MTTPIVVEHPNSPYDFLRYQVVVHEQRFASGPDYQYRKSHKVMGHHKEEAKVPVLTLLGFGSTLEKAEAMARRAADKRGIKLL